MRTVLGLDLGPSSLGWCLADADSGRLLDLGVRVFPEGVDRDKQGGEVSKNETRRMKRAMRRQIQRRARRRRLLREALIEIKLYPADPDAQAELDGRDPYELRARALDEELHPHEIGRIFLHLAQRRGFLSMRRSDRVKKEEDPNTDENVQNGEDVQKYEDPKQKTKKKNAKTDEDSKILAEISELAGKIEISPARTLGEYLHLQTAKPGEPVSGDARIRGVHTRRDMFLTEFNQIWEAQEKHHPDLLTQTLMLGERGDKQQFPQKPEPLRPGKLPGRPTGAEDHAMAVLQRFGIHGMIYFQRPIYWPLSAVGFCELEPRQRRAPRADRLAQRCRMYQEVNNLRLIDGRDQERELTPDERQKLLDFLRVATEKGRTFDQIRKHLGLLESARFSVETSAKGAADKKGRSTIKGIPTDAVLSGKGCFGPAWFDRSEDERDYIVRQIIDETEDETNLRESLMKRWGLTGGRADAVMDADLLKGYGKLSIMALERLEPYLERGMPMMAGQGEGRDEHGRATDAIHAAGYLRPDQRHPKVLGELPQPPDLPNPLVRQALHEVRKVVNAVIREHGKPDEVHVELARDVKGSLERRKTTRIDSKKREKERAAAADFIREQGFRVGRDGIDRVRLWREQDEQCIYSGRTISPQQLLGGEVDVDHILPRSQSLDNSMANKVVCFRDANRDKGQRTPRAWLEGDPERYEAVIQRARKLGHYGKYLKFKQNQVDLDDFIARQLVDTGYISRKVVEYLKHLGVHVIGTKGQLTAELRRQWGLDRVLRADDLDLKNRDDHRHHAVDAVVIALTNHSRLQELSKLHLTGEAPADLDPHVRDQVVEMLDHLHVSHKPTRRVSGQLHEETIYGKPDDEGAYAYRKPLEALTLNEIDRIRDKAVKERVIERLAEHGCEPGRGKKTNIPAAAWQQPLYMKQRAEKRKAGNPRTQIKKVRLSKPEKSVVPLRESEDGRVTAYVKPGSVHHVAIFELPNGKYEGVFVSLLEASRRRRERREIVERVHPDQPDAKYVMSLSSGDLVLLREGDNKGLRVVTTLVSTQQRIHTKDARDARPSGQRGADFGSTCHALITKYKMVRVTVDPLGQLRNADTLRPASNSKSGHEEVKRIAADAVAAGRSNQQAHKTLRQSEMKHLGAVLTAELHRLRERSLP